MPVNDDFHADGYEGNPLFSDGIYIVSGKTGSEMEERESRFMFMLRHGIMAGAAERVAAGDAFQCQPAAFKGTVCLHCFHGILRTSRREAAARRNERADGILVKPNQQKHQFGQRRFHRCFRIISWASWSRASGAFPRVNKQRTCTT